MSKQRSSSLPLVDKRILVTRTREQAQTLSEQLQALGATAIEFPTIRIVPPSDWQELDTALGKLFLANAQELPYYSWLIFTSANGVNTFCQRLLSLGFHTQLLSGVRVAAIGPATAAALARYGIPTDLVPGEYIAEDVAATLIEDARQRGEPLMGKRILLPRAAEARKVLVTELQHAGALVDEIAAYYTFPVTGDDEQGHSVFSLLRNHEIDIMTFTSSSTVRNFMHWLAGYEEQYEQAFIQGMLHNPRLKIACIGPITSQTARDLGLDVHSEAREYTIAGLVEAIIQLSLTGTH